MSKTIVTKRRILALFIYAIVCASPISAQDPDRDGDGLSDFWEVHKYLTDPKKPDTDQDGRFDGDWLERRECQYTVRSLVQVMKPVTPDFLCDDYQDARVIDETNQYIELEVVHYPFNTVASSISADDNWRETIRNPSLGLEHWLKPGPTADWSPELRDEIDAALRSDGIKLSSLNDREIVERVSNWLLKRAEYHDGFSTFVTAFDSSGRPYIPDELKEHVGRGSDLAAAEQWQREISAAGMFRSRVHGSCSSAAIYLNGCLRAVGIPTRTVLCIPLVDANDESEIAMLRRLQQSGVRQSLLKAIAPLKGSWASHTFNEVFVGGRWRRLNYQRLGQNIYDPGLFGMMTHVATFQDWADARMHETIGKRQSLGHGGDVFGGPNPYSTISLRDEMGECCRLELPEADTIALTVERVRWTDSMELPAEIRDNCRERGRFGLIAEVTGFADSSEIPDFLAQADLRVFLTPVTDAVGQAGREKAVPRLGVGFDSGCYWLTNSLLRIYVPFGAGDRRDLVPQLAYEFNPRNANQGYEWRVTQKLVVVRHDEESEK